MAMALSLLFTIFTTTAVLVFPSTSAKDYIVGDGTGWTTNFDYQAWAKGKEFRIGDKLIFKYAEGAHNVIRADGDSFKKCTKPSNVEALTTGNDKITLSTAGKKWYFCGVGKHCEDGNQKLVINVLAEGQEGSSPSAAAARTGGVMALVVLFFAVIVVYM